MAGSAMISAEKSRCVFVFTINYNMHIIMIAENFAPHTSYNEAKVVDTQ